MKTHIKSHFLRIIIKGVILISIVLPSLKVYSLGSDVLDDKGSLQALDFQEAFKKTSLVGAILNRGDGTSCGLIVEDKTLPSSTKETAESAESNPSILTLKENLRKTLNQHNIPLCSSAEDFRVIEEADPFLKIDQIFFEDPPVQVAGLGKFLFSSPLRATLTSIGGTCLISASLWSVTFFYNAEQVKSFVQKHHSIPLGSFNQVMLALASTVVGGMTSMIVVLGVDTISSKGFLKEGMNMGARGEMTSFLAGVACHFLGKYPVMMLLDSIYGK